MANDEDAYRQIAEQMAGPRSIMADPPGRLPPVDPAALKRYITAEAYKAGKPGVPLPPDTEVPSFEEWHGRPPSYAERHEMDRGIIPEVDTDRWALQSERMSAVMRDVPIRSIKADPPGRHARVNVQQLDFPSAMDALLSGERISRLSWSRGFIVGDFVTVAKIPEFQVFTSRDIPMKPVRPQDMGREYVTHDRVTLGNSLIVRRVATGTWEKFTVSDADIFAKDWIVI